MEMECIQLKDDCNSIERGSVEQLCPPDPPDIKDVFGDPLLNPRVGDEFQVEIPPMSTKSELFQLLKNPADSKVMVDASHSFLVGLPIPVVWVHVEDYGIEEEGFGFPTKHDNAVNSDGHVKSRNSKKNRSSMKKKCSKPKVETSNVVMDHGKELRRTNLGTKMGQKANLDQLCKRKGHGHVPGSLGDPWSDAEVDIFLLGLYIFGKNFIDVKRFMENKKMEDILSFYYGRFYRSDGHHKWSDCRKKKIRKGVTGRKIFEGWRQQELLSRLLPHIPKELQNTLLEVSRTFAEEKSSLEEYVSFLKTTVGIRVLVEAVAIGKGKEDLTGHAMDPTKTNKVLPVCPEIPIGKACSSLTSSDIMTYLTGDFRLSKARCNDIFWEAVWPRLLARGWHSEQTKNHGYNDSNHDLVFLVSGVDKFSRRKLVKGEHYFDSVSDVLSKVVSEPKLLDVETEEARVDICTKVNAWVPEEIPDQDDLSDHQRHCYLKPRASICNPNLVKFTVVDTSLVHEGKLPKVRELRHMPDEFRSASKMTGLSGKKEGNYFEDSREKFEVDAKNSEGTFDCGCPNRTRFTVVDTSLVEGGKSSELRELRLLPDDLTSEVSSRSKEIKGNSCGDSLAEQKLVVADTLSYGEQKINNSNHSEGTYEGCGLEPKTTINNSDTASKMEEIDQDQRVNTSDDEHSKNFIKHEFPQKKKSGQSNYLTPPTKRRKLTSCAKADTKHVIEKPQVQLDSGYMLRSPDISKNVDSDQVSHKEKISSVISSDKSSPEEDSGVCILSENCFGADKSLWKNEKHQPRPRPLIDLNYPPVSMDSEYCEPLTMEVEHSQINTNEDTSCFPSNTNKVVEEPEALRNSVDVDTAEQQPRRQSRRNRPLSTRALEALASGFLKVKRGRKERF